MVTPQSGISQHIYDDVFVRACGIGIEAFPHGIVHAHPINSDIVTESTACSSMDMKHQL